MHVRYVAIDLHRSTQSRDRFIELTDLLQGISQVVVRCGGVGTEFQDAAMTGERVARKSDVKQRVA